MVNTCARCEDEEPPVVVPLLVRIQPDVVEVALVAVQVEVQRVAVAITVHEEMCGKLSVPLPIEYSPGCIEFGIENPPASRTKELLCLRNCETCARGSRNRRDSDTSYFRIRLSEAVTADAQSAYTYYPYQ